MKQSYCAQRPDAFLFAFEVFFLVQFNVSRLTIMGLKASVEFHGPLLLCILVSVKLNTEVHTMECLECYSTFQFSICTKLQTHT